MLVESVSKWPWNECPSQRGIAVQVFVEWVSKCAWNPYLENLPINSRGRNVQNFSRSANAAVLSDLEKVSGES